MQILIANMPLALEQLLTMLKGAWAAHNGLNWAPAGPLQRSGFLKTLE